MLFSVLFSSSMLALVAGQEHYDRFTARESSLKAEVGYLEGRYNHILKREDPSWSARLPSAGTCSSRGQIDGALNCLRDPHLAIPTSAHCGPCDASKYKEGDDCLCKLNEAQKIWKNAEDQGMTGVCVKQRCQELQPGGYKVCGATCNNHNTPCHCYPKGEREARLQKEAENEDPKKKAAIDPSSLKGNCRPGNSKFNEAMYCQVKQDDGWKACSGPCQKNGSPCQCTMIPVPLADMEMPPKKRNRNVKVGQPSADRPVERVAKRKRPADAETGGPATKKPNLAS